MSAWLRRRMRSEDGISLIEVLVSILILGLVLSALATTLFSSMAAARQNEGLTKGTAVANEMLEKLRSEPWAALPPGAISNTVLPTPVNRDDRSYNVTGTVANVDAAGRFRRYTVNLSWVENGQTQNLTVEGRRTRRTHESVALPPPPNPFRVRSFTIFPDPVMLDTANKSLPATNPALPGDAAMMLEVEMSEAARTNSVIVTWPTSQTLTLTEVSGSGGKKWTGTVASGLTYTPGWLTFRVVAAKAGTTTTCTASPLPASTDCAEATSAAYFLAPIQNGPLYYDDNNQRQYKGTPGPKHETDPTLSGDRLCLNPSTAKLRNNNPFYLGLKGLSTDDTVLLRRTDVAGVEFQMEWTKVQTSWWWYADVASNPAGTFTVGTNSTWEVQWIRGYDNLSGKIPLTFYIQNASGNSPC